MKLVRYGNPGREKPGLIDLVTPDELANVQRLDMWLDVNGQRMQTGNTRTMIFNVAAKVNVMTLGSRGWPFAKIDAAGALQACAPEPERSFVIPA